MVTIAKEHNDRREGSAARLVSPAAVAAAISVGGALASDNRATHRRGDLAALEKARSVKYKPPGS